MAYTVEQRDKLKAAIALGARKITYSDGSGGTQEMTFRDLDEMQTILRAMEAELGTTRPPRRRFHYFEHHKGLRP